MDLEKIKDILSEQSDSPKDLFELKRLVEKYPYTEIFRLIYLRELKKRDEELFEQELQSSSAHFTNRRFAYYFVNDIKVSAFSSLMDYDTAMISTDYFALDPSESAKESLRQLAAKLREARLAKISEEAEKSDDEAKISDKERVRRLVGEKKYFEALRLLKKINLNNSEKNAYFAVQIKYLETILNFKG